VAYATVSEDKEEPNKSGNASECNEALPAKPAKNWSNILIKDEDSSVELNQERDDEEPDNGHYQDQEESI